MRKQELLELIKYLKEHDLVKKYNCMYEKYDKQYDRENIGFNLEMIYSLTPGEIKSILSSKNDTESLFKLRMHSLGYDEFMPYHLSCDENVILRVIEEIHRKQDFNEFDPSKELITCVAAMGERQLKNIEIFYIHMGSIPKYSQCDIELKDLIDSLKIISKCTNSGSVELISELTLSKEKRDICHLNIDSDYYMNVLDVISNLKYRVQVDSIEELLKYNLTSEPKSNGILSLFQEKKDKIAALRLFEISTTENACKEMVRTLKDNRNDIIRRPKYVLGQLSICSELGEDESLIRLSCINSIEELENVLSSLDNYLDIDRNLRVKVKKK